MIKKFSLGFIAFLQSLGLVVYISLIALLFFQGEKWFGNVPNYWGPFLLLTLFCTSALVSAILTLGYPIILFWEKEKTVEALKLVVYTAGWLIFFIFIFIGAITLF